MSMYLWVGFCLSFWGMQCSLHKISQPTYPPYISNPLPSWRISEFQHGFNLIRVHCFLWCHFHFCLGLGSICLFFFRFRGPQRMLKTPQNEVFYADMRCFHISHQPWVYDLQNKNPPPFRGAGNFSALKYVFVWFNHGLFLCKWIIHHNPLHDPNIPPSLPFEASTLALALPLPLPLPDGKRENISHRRRRLQKTIHKRVRCDEFSQEGIKNIDLNWWLSQIESKWSDFFKDAATKSIPLLMMFQRWASKEVRLQRVALKISVGSTRLLHF